jgi:hypothetical protein
MAPRTCLNRNLNWEKEIDFIVYPCEWVDKCFIANVHKNGIEFGKKDTDYHLKVNKGDSEGELNIYNGSMAQQSYILEDISGTKRWLCTIIESGETHTVKAQSVNVYLQNR